MLQEPPEEDEEEEEEIYKCEECEQEISKEEHEATVCPNGACPKNMREKLRKEMEAEAKKNSKEKAAP